MTRSFELNLPSHPIHARPDCPGLFQWVVQYLADTFRQRLMLTSLLHHLAPSAQPTLALSVTAVFLFSQITVLRRGSNLSSSV